MEQKRPLPDGRWFAYYCCRCRWLQEPDEKRTRRVEAIWCPNCDYGEAERALFGTDLPGEPAFLPPPGVEALRYSRHPRGSSAWLSDIKALVRGDGWQGRPETELLERYELLREIIMDLAAEWESAEDRLESAHERQIERATRT